MLDFILLLVAALAQLALGALGLRVSTHPPRKANRWRYELAFVLIGLVGIGAIVRSGVRSVSVQQTIADGVERIQVKLGIGGQSNFTEETKIFLQCDFALMPKTMPTSGEIFIVEPHSASPSLIGMGGAQTAVRAAGKPSYYYLDVKRKGRVGFWASLPAIQLWKQPDIRRYSNLQCCNSWSKT
jgi:hypothetical protein